MMVKRACSTLVVGLCSALGAFGPYSLVGAQESGPRADLPTLEEVTVTARRREESLQKTPVSVTAVTGELLD